MDRRRSNNRLNDANQYSLDGSVFTGRFRSPLCSVCKHSVPIKNDGLVCVHGPIKCHCPGFNQPPFVPPLSEDSATLTPGDAPLSFTLKDTTKVSLGAKVIKKIPRGSRDQAACKFVDVLGQLAVENSVDA